LRGEKIRLKRRRENVGEREVLTEADYYHK
jgi:hypothetical protein